MIYTIFNGAKNTTAAPVKVATGTAIKTLLQLKPLIPCRVIEWGISFDGSAAATPGAVEFIETDVAATSLTAHVNADITQVDAEAIAMGDPTSALISVGTSATGYTAGAEGTTTAVRNLDGPQLMAPTIEYIKQFPLGREPVIQANKFCRVRVTFAATVNALTYITVAF